MWQFLRTSKCLFTKESKFTFKQVVYYEKHQAAMYTNISHYYYRQEGKLACSVWLTSVCFFQKLVSNIELHSIPANFHTKLLLFLWYDALIQLHFRCTGRLGCFQTLAKNWKCFNRKQLLVSNEVIVMDLLDVVKTNSYNITFRGILAAKKKWSELFKISPAKSLLLLVYQ